MMRVYSYFYDCHLAYMKTFYHEITISTGTSFV